MIPLSEITDLYVEKKWLIKDIAARFGYFETGDRVQVAQIGDQNKEASFG